MKLDHITGLRCVACGKVYGQEEVMYTCPSCGIAGILAVEYDYDRIARGGFGRDSLARAERNLWRYLPLLPLDPRGELPTLQIGWTPVMDLPQLASRWGVAKLWVKDDGRLPTGSFNDRASAVGATRAT